MSKITCTISSPKTNQLCTKKCFSCFLSFIIAFDQMFVNIGFSKDRLSELGIISRRSNFSEGCCGMKWLCKTRKINVKGSSNRLDLSQLWCSLAAGKPHFHISSTLWVDNAILLLLEAKALGRWLPILRMKKKRLRMRLLNFPPRTFSLQLTPP